MKLALTVLCVTLMAVPGYAQGEAALRSFFEGKTVVVKIDMPATAKGIDIYPEAARPLDFSKYAERIKEAGTALRKGDSILVTKIRVKSKNIEFQLGGGGFGTFGDDTSLPVASTAGKSTREKNLERDIKRETDPKKKREMQEELDDLRREREREDRRAQAEAARERDRKVDRIANQRLQGGSRFNLFYQNGVPPGLTPQAVMAALRDYVDFSDVAPMTDREPSPPASVAPAAAIPASSTPIAGSGRLRKGMTREEAETAMGKPDKVSDRAEGGMKITTLVFIRDEQRIEADFIEGVLIKYTISSK